jgi:hypothetical protein
MTYDRKPGAGLVAGPRSALVPTTKFTFIIASWFIRILFCHARRLLKLKERLIIEKLRSGLVMST